VVCVARVDVRSCVVNGLLGTGTVPLCGCLAQLVLGRCVVWGHSKGVCRNPTTLCVCGGSVWVVWECVEVCVCGVGVVCVCSHGECGVVGKVCVGCGKVYCVARVMVWAWEGGAVCWGVGGHVCVLPVYNVTGCPVEWWLRVVCANT